jgi:hypothetical protein
MLQTKSLITVFLSSASSAWQLHPQSKFGPQMNDEVCVFLVDFLTSAVPDREDALLSRVVLEQAMRVSLHWKHTLVVCNWQAYLSDDDINVAVPSKICKLSISLIWRNYVLNALRLQHLFREEVRSLFH